MKLTALIACKNREANLTHCLVSIEQCTPRPSVVIVDFGSKVPVHTFAKKYPWVTTIRVTRKTDLFHKARALNIGLRTIRTPFFCATDTDQIFQPNFFGVVLSTLLNKKRSVVLCKSYFLKVHPKPAETYEQLLEKAKASTTKVHGEGCCTGLWTKWAQNTHGWDEAYVGYGAEDSDVILRANLCKFSTVWVNKRTSTIHLPHPKTGVYYSNKAYFAENKRRYLLRKLNKDIIVNTHTPWGVK